jgi:spheroidene monooxygenase
MQKTETSVLLLIKFKKKNLLWGLGHLAFKRFFMRNIEGLLFFKVLGSGSNAGFGVSPSFIHQGLLCHFESEDNAEKFICSNDIVNYYKSKSDEFFLTKLQTYSSRGSWAGKKMKEVVTEPFSGPIASLTRASIKISKAIKFWSLAPETEVSLNNSDGCILAVGLGEAPLLRQATFTIWKDSQYLDLFARQGSHLDAIHLAYKKKYFAESMFIRFKTESMQGTWRGVSFD